MRDGQELTVVSLMHAVPLFLYPELQINADDPLQVAFKGQATQPPEDR